MQAVSKHVCLGRVSNALAIGADRRSLPVSGRAGFSLVCGKDVDRSQFLCTAV